MREKNNLIKMSNELAQKLSITDKTDMLNITQKAILYYLMSKIRPEDTVTKKEKIYISEFCKLFKIDYASGQAKNRVRNSILNLKNKKFYLEEESSHIYWVEDSVEISDDKTTVYIKLHQNLHKYLFDLESNYTFFKLGYICGFKSKYSWRVYEFCHSWLSKGKISVTIRNVLSKIGLGQYDSYGEFRKRVLQPAIEEINQNTDIIVQFYIKKEKGKVIGLVFEIRKKPEDELSKLDKNFVSEPVLKDIL